MKKKPSTWTLCDTKNSKAHCLCNSLHFLRTINWNNSFDGHNVTVGEGKRQKSNCSLFWCRLHFMDHAKMVLLRLPVLSLVLQSFLITRCSQWQCKNKFLSCSSDMKTVKQRRLLRTKKIKNVLKLFNRKLLEKQIQTNHKREKKRCYKIIVTFFVSFFSAIFHFVRVFVCKLGA